MAYAFLQNYRANEKGNVDIVRLIERSVTEIDIPYGITKLGNYIFCGCGAVIKISIPESVTEIGGYACNGLGSSFGIDEVVIPDSVTLINGNAFTWSGVKKFVISKNISTIQAAAFGGCSKCELYDFSRCEAVPTLANVNVFDQMTNYKKAKILVPPLLYKEWIAATNWATYADYIKLRPSEGLGFSYDENNNCYRIDGRGDFIGEAVVIPESYDDGINGVAPVENFGPYCFQEDSTILFAYVPETIEDFNYYSFSSCANLKILYIPGATRVSSFEFSSLSSLEYVKFGKSILEIGGGSFTGMSGAVFDFSEAESIPSLNSYGAGWEFGTDPIIKVPQSLCEEWKNDTNWVNYAEYIVAAD